MVGEHLQHSDAGAGDAQGGATEQRFDFGPGHPLSLANYLEHFKFTALPRPWSGFLRSTA